MQGSKTYNLTICKIHGWFYIQILTNTMYHNNRKQHKNYMVISIYAENFDIIRHSFIIKISTGDSMILPQYNKGHVYKTHTALTGVARWIGIVLQTKEVTGSIPSWGTCLGCGLSP